MPDQSPGFGQSVQPQNFRPVPYEITEQTQPEAAPEPKPALLSLEAAELILDAILIDCAYDEWAVDDILRVIWTLTHQPSLRDVEQYADDLIKRVHHWSNDCWDRAAAYIATLPGKSYREDGLTIEQLVNLQYPNRERIEGTYATVTGEKPPPPRETLAGRPLHEVQMALTWVLAEYVAHPDLPAETAELRKEKVSRLRDTERNPGRSQE